VKSLLLLSSIVLGGCFFVNPINQRPSLEIENPSSEAVARGDTNLSLVARVDDPEGQIVKLDWRLYACDDAAAFETCDPVPKAEGSSPTFTFDAPVARANGTAAQSLLVELRGIDDLGAEARPVQQLIIPLGNAKPDVVVTHTSRYGKTVGTPIDVFAVYGDADDTAGNVELEFILFSPTASTVKPEALCEPGELGCMPGLEGKLEIGKRFTPDVTGEWMVQVIARDPLGKTDSEDGITTIVETVVVVVDQLPCLGVVSPAAPPDGNQLPIGEPTLFQVHQIVDAIDPYPSNVGDPILGQSTFHWSMKVNSGGRQTLATETGSNVALDPDAFDPGDVIELRVEIADRGSPFPLTCDPADATCQLDPTLDPVCLQRQTWKVVVQ
jgi:hypothetical protein